MNRGARRAAAGRHCRTLTEYALLGPGGAHRKIPARQRRRRWVSSVMAAAKVANRDRFEAEKPKGGRWVGLRPGWVRSKAGLAGVVGTGRSTQPVRFA
jgi:hypothetical protein